MKNKLLKLQKKLKKLKKVLIAFSGGTDSSFLLAYAIRVLGKDKVSAITAVSETYPSNEMVRVTKLIKKFKINHQFITTHELRNRLFQKNSKRRCFFCKDELFSKLQTFAKKQENIVCDGSNASDICDYRPGKLAAKKWNIASPLEEAGLNKDEIRALSRKMRLPTWNIPAQACLASRFPYGTPITKDVLQRIEKGENIIRNLGFETIRLRHHKDIARIEIDSNKIHKMFEPATKQKIISSLKKLGWKHIAVDIEGYRTGSLN